MSASAPLPHAEHLKALVRESVWLMGALRAVRSLGLGSWCIGAGAVRNLVWNHLHGFDVESHLSDVDVVFFDPNDCSAVYERQLQERLNQAIPGLAWEVVNQARVHQWVQTAPLEVVPPFKSLEEGVASWPEYATCVGVFLRHDDTVEVIAPHGLKDLFTMTIRWNPTRVSAHVFRERVAKKRFSERWPLVQVVPAANAL